MKLPFSWGAAGAQAFWLWARGRRGLAVLLFFGKSLLWLAAGDTIALIVDAVTTVWLGMVGSEIAIDHQGYRTIDELKSGERIWTILGFISIALEIVLTIAAYSLSSYFSLSDLME
jgi:hypothetical protein